MSAPRISFLCLLAMAAVGPAPTAQAQSHSVTQSITLRVLRVTRMSVSGSPTPLALLDLDESSGTASVTDRSTSYTIFSNVDQTRITASIDRPVPEGTRLEIALESSLGTSQGPVDISQATGALDVVTAIRRGVEVNRPITYTFSADASIARAFEDEPRTVTFTILE